MIFKRRGDGCCPDRSIFAYINIKYYIDGTWQDYKALQNIPTGMLAADSYELERIISLDPFEASKVKIMFPAAGVNTNWAHGRLDLVL